VRRFTAEEGSGSERPFSRACFAVVNERDSGAMERETSPEAARIDKASPGKRVFKP
jgi:hypothetical protein